MNSFIHNSPVGAFTRSTFVIDVDGVVCGPNKSEERIASYIDCEPLPEAVAKILADKNLAKLKCDLKLSTESAKMKAKRKSFKARHAKNIAKGKMSAAYWADKVKW